MNSKSPIGVLDSGIGGLTVWCEIVNLLPYESTIYYADIANCPYGTKEFPEIVELTNRCIEILVNRQVKMIVIACNTITSAAISKLRSEYPEILFVGMEPAVKPAALITQSGVIGILATQATLSGEMFQIRANNLAPNLKLIPVAGTGLVELIEAGAENRPECEALVRQYIEPMLEQGADTLVLGCTHYPILTNLIDKISSGRLTIVNPAPAVARQVHYLLESWGLLNIDTATAPSHLFLSSQTDHKADPAVERRARELLKR